MWWFRKKSSSIIDLANSIWGISAGGKMSADTSMRVADIYSCVRVLSNTLASLPVSLHYADIRRGKASDHAYHRLLHRKPNQWMTPSDFKRLMVAHLVLTGNFYAYKNKLGGMVRELIPIHPDNVDIKQNDDLTIDYTITLKNGQKRNYSSNDIMHIRSLTLDGIKGLSIVEIMADVFGYSRDAQLFQNRVLRNGAKPSGLLVFPDALKDEQYLKEIERINAAASGENTGSTLILDRGVEFKKVSLSTSDLMLIDSMKLTTSKICGIMGVPPHMIGDLERATNNNIEHQSLEYYVFGAMPICTMIEEGLNAALLDELKDGDSYSYKFNASAILRGDFKSRMEGYQIGIMNGIINPDEARELEDRAPRGDGFGSDYYYPANLLPAGTKPKQIETKEKRSE